MVKPLLILVDGPIGAGKSSVSKLLHKKMKDTALISLDRIKHLISDYKPNDEKYLSLASKIGVSMTSEYLKNNFNVIVEKAFTREKFLNKFLKKFNKKAKIFVYQIEAPMKIRIVRVKQRPILPDAKGKPSKEKIKRNTEHYELYKYKNARVFDSTKLTSKKIANRILKEVI